MNILHMLKIYISFFKLQVYICLDVLAEFLSTALQNVMNKELSSIAMHPYSTRDRLTVLTLYRYFFSSPKPKCFWIVNLQFGSNQ